MLLSLLPFLAFFSVFWFDHFENSFFIVILYIIIAAIFFVLTLKSSYGLTYVFAIFIFSLTLMYSISLQSTYVVGADIHIEIFLSNYILETGYWDSSQIISIVYAMASIVFLAPIYAITSGTNLVTLFKVIYPFLFSFLPICIYRIIEKQTDSRIAFISVFAFIISSSYFSEMVSLARQEIAMIFVALLLLAILDKKLEYWFKSLLCILFSICVIISHYGIAPILFGILLMSIIIISFLNNENVVKIFDNLSVSRIKIPFFNRKIDYHSREILNLYFLVLFLVLSFAWYFYISNSKVFDYLVDILELMKNASSGDVSW